MKLILTFLLLAVAVFAGEQQDLDKQVNIWKSKFGMKDWTIVVTPVSVEELIKIHPAGPILGASQYDVESRSGVILVLRRADYPEFKKSLILNGFEVGKKDLVDPIKDQKDTVVHELLHNIFQNANQEFAVSELAHLLLEHK